MKTVRGRYNGQVVVLEHRVEVDREVEVLVQFPDEPARTDSPTLASRRWHWMESSVHLRDLPVSASEEVIRQRRLD